MAIHSLQDESFVSKLDIILDPFKETLEKATKALKLSAKSPFDISMLDDVVNLSPSFCAPLPLMKLSFLILSESGIPIP